MTSFESEKSYREQKISFFPTGSAGGTAPESGRGMKSERTAPGIIQAVRPISCVVFLLLAFFFLIKTPRLSIFHRNRMSHI